MTQTLKVAASVLVLVFGGTGFAQAVEFAQRDPEFPPRAYTCRADGKDVPLGQMRCLRTAQGATEAECGIILNVSTWRPAPGACR